MLLSVSDSFVYLAKAKSVVSSEFGARVTRRNHPSYCRDADSATLERRLPAETFRIETNAAELDVGRKVGRKLRSIGVERQRRVVEDRAA